MEASLRARAESGLTWCHGQDMTKVQANFMITASGVGALK
jgi:hypothetical protein